MRKALARREFESEEELQAELDRLQAGGLPPATANDPLAQAQEFIYAALDAPTRADRVRFALKALETSADCADAYVLLAEEAAESLEQECGLYRMGVEAGERALGPEPFQGDVGYFWGLLETRPYMRAREGLADTLWHLGREADALQHYREMLRLNPNDNQGIRYRLLGCLVETGLLAAAGDLFEKYPGDASGGWAYTGALVRYLLEGESARARTAFRRALKKNRHIPAYLTGERRVPEYLPEFVGFGDEDEAVAYAAEFGHLWAGAPGAVGWLAAMTA
ncbi:MAG: tetratricopeptide repeat protein [Dehalococcoidia bacterium]